MKLWNSPKIPGYQFTLKLRNTNFNRFKQINIICIPISTKSSTWRPELKFKSFLAGSCREQPAIQSCPSIHLIVYEIWMNKMVQQFQLAFWLIAFALYFKKVPPSFWERCDVFFFFFIIIIRTMVYFSPKRNGRWRGWSTRGGHLLGYHKSQSILVLLCQFKAPRREYRWAQ